MVVRLAPNRHKRSKDFVRYHLKELEAVTGTNRFQVLNPNGTVLFEGRRKDVVAWFDRVNGPRRSQRDGMAGIWSCPADVKYALKAGGLISTPQDAYRLFAPTFKPVMQTFAKRAVAQTMRRNAGTGKLEKAYVRVIPVFLAAPANNTRSGEAELSLDFMIAKKGWDPVGKKWRSIDFNKLMLVQGEAQAAGNQALGYALRDRGIIAVPTGKSISAIGYTAQPQGSAKINAAGAGRAGPKARAAVAQRAAAGTKKTVVPWAEALANVKGTVNAALAKSVMGMAVKLDDAVQAGMAAGAVRDAFNFHAATGAARYAEGTVKGTAAHLALPHVKPEILDAVWDRMTQHPTRLGAREVVLYPNGARMFAPVAQTNAEHRLGKQFARARGASVRGLSQRDVVGSMATQGLTGEQRRDLYELCGDGGLRWASRYGNGLLPLAVRAYERTGRNVFAVGDPAVGAKLGLPTFSPSGLVDSATRTSHLRSLWTGLRLKGPFGDWLGAAEEVRASGKARIPINKGDLVVLAPGGLKDARAVEAVMKLCAQKGAKVMMAGAGAEQYRGLQQKRGVHL